MFDCSGGSRGGGGQGVQANPLQVPVFKYAINIKYFGLSGTKLFHFQEEEKIRKMR